MAHLDRESLNGLFDTLAAWNESLADIPADLLEEISLDADPDPPAP